MCHLNVNVNVKVWISDDCMTNMDFDIKNNTFYENW